MAEGYNMTLDRIELLDLVVVNAAGWVARAKRAEDSQEASRAMQQLASNVALISRMLRDAEADHG